MRPPTHSIFGRISACHVRTLFQLHHQKQRASRRLPRQFVMVKSTLSSTENVPSIEYELIEGVERLERYRPGGYHPVLIGDVFKDRYRVAHKLGHGTYSTIWLCRDELQDAYVAVKINTDDSPADESDILCTLREPSQAHPGLNMIPRVQDHFEIHGPNGHHRCSVTSPAQSSVAAASFSREFEIETARALVAQLVLAVAYTHSRGFVHGDIHLGNALIQLPCHFHELSVAQLYEKFGKPYTELVVRLDGKALPPGVPSHGIALMWLGKKANKIPLTEARLLLSDFGEAFRPSDPHQKRLGNQCHTPLPVLPPEAYFEPDKPLSFPADIWCLACAIWSILGPRPLFDGTLATCDDITSQQVDILGPLPREWWHRWGALNKYFDRETGKPHKGRYIVQPLTNHFEDQIQAPRRKDGMGEFSKEEMKDVLSMLRSMLAFKPDERVTANAVLSSDWMVNWALPMMERDPKD